jgi:hypothetical protein
VINPQDWVRRGVRGGRGAVIDRFVGGRRMVHGKGPWLRSPHPVKLTRGQAQHTPALYGNTVRSFSTHGQLSTAQGSPTTVSR